MTATSKKWSVRRRRPELSRRDRWVLALLFSLAIGAAVACPAAVQYLSSGGSRPASITGVVAAKGVIPPAPKHVVPIRWYVMVDTDEGERMRFYVDHATYMQLSRGVRVHRGADGTVSILSNRK